MIRGDKNMPLFNRYGTAAVDLEKLSPHGLRLDGHKGATIIVQFDED